MVGSEFRIFFDYDQALVSAVKALPNRRFVRDSKLAFWSTTASCAANAAAVVNFASTNGFAVQPQASALLTKLASTPLAAQISAEYQGEQLVNLLISTRCYDPQMNEVIKSAGSAKFDGETKTWKLPFTRVTAGIVAKLISEYNLTIESGLAAKINAQVGTLDQLITLSGQRDSDAVIPAPAGLTYLGFQKPGIAYAVEKGNVLIADEPGLGKTIQAIGISNAVADIKSVLVICPATPRLNWKREWLKWCVKGLKVAVVSGSAPEEWPTDADVVITSFKLVGYHLDRIHSRTWDMLVVDEAHNLKNPKAKRTPVILGAPASKKGRVEIAAVPAIPAKRLVLLTGTPIVNRPLELWPLISAVNPARWNSFFNFAKRYCNAAQGPYGWNFDGASNLDELQSELRASCMVRRTKAEVLPDLPKKTRQIIVLENNAIAAKEKKVIASIEKKLADLEAAKTLAYLSNDPTAYLTAAAELKMYGKASFEEISILRHKTALAKVQDVVELVKEGLETGKVILFAHHQDVLSAYKLAFGDSAVVVTGDTPMTARQAAVDRFQTDPACNLFIGSIQAAGTALTLTAATMVIFGEVDWVPGNMSQAEDRAHRIGQKDNVLVWHAVVDGTIEARMIKVLVGKQEVIDAAMDSAFTSAVVNVESSEDFTPSEIILPELDLISDEEINAWLTRATTKSSSKAAARISERAKSRGFQAEAEAVSADEIQMIHDNLTMLAGVCDGAVEQDNQGFNASDTYVGRTLAALPALTPLQAVYARKMMGKYVRQLGTAAIAGMGAK